MLSNYFILAYRNLISNKITSTINIVGLSIAIACGIAVFLILKNFWTLDDFHVNGDRIFMVEYTIESEGATLTYGDPPALLGSALASDFPQVKKVVRVEKEGVRVFTKESVIGEMITYADTNFFQMFTFPLKYGSPSVLSDPTALILSNETAEKYFPGQNPVGQAFTVIRDNQEKKEFTIQAVAEKFPDNTGFHFAMLTGYHEVHAALKNQDWSSHIAAVFIETLQPKDVVTIASLMNPYIALYNTKNIEKPIKSIVFDNLRHPAPSAYDVYRRPAEANHPFITILFSSIALLMLGLSCFNYINISLGAVTRRLKEIGIRKVMGGTRGQLIAQFMIENLLLCFVAMLLGLVITAGFLVPLFNGIMIMNISLSFAKNMPLWGFLGGMLAFTALASGAYPALYVSAFQPLAVFAGKQKFGNKTTFRRVLLTVQFVLAFLAVIGGVVLTSMGQQWKAVSWGYNPDQTMVLRLSDSTQYQRMKQSLSQNAAITSIAGTVEHVGESISIQELWVGEEKARVMCFNVGADYLDVMGLKIRSGQCFDPSRPAENATSVLVNETLIQKYQWGASALGQTIRVGEKAYHVIGTVKDFKGFGTGAMRPAVFFAAKESDFQYLVANFEPGKGANVASNMEEIWKSNFSGLSASHFYQKDVFDGFNTTVQSMSAAFGYIAALALLIACMGLYGLATQHFARRAKEVSVRKVLGASIRQIIVLVNREFMVLLLIAGCISTSICYVGIHIALQYTQEFTGSFKPSLSSFVVANLIVIITAGIAVGRQSWRMANMQLSEVLKND